ncbi:MAG: hypothetical protein AAGA12_07975 [Pseudomonadota bacterium]
MRLALLLTSSLAACSTGPDLWDGTTSRHDVAGYRFKVVQNGVQASAFRVNVMARPGPGVYQAGLTAIEQASGCAVDRSSVSGDVAMMSADLIC